MSRIDDIEAILEDGRYKTETKIDCIHSIIDENKLTVKEWVDINELFDDKLYGGVKEIMSIKQAVEQYDS